MRLLVVVPAAAIVGSLFLPWFDSPFGGRIVPVELLQEIDFSTMPDVPPLVLAFLATFPLAALLFFLGISNGSTRLLALVTGLIPFGLLAYGVVQAGNEMSNLGGFQPRGEDIAQVFDELLPLIGAGAMLYLGSAFLLVIAGLTGSSARST
jgi:hypothetical protein